MTQQTEIKTLKDGSIDYSHYITKSHAIRSNDAHQALAAIWRMLEAAWKSAKLHVVFRPGPNQAHRERKCPPAATQQKLALSLLTP